MLHLARSGSRSHHIENLLGEEAEILWAGGRVRSSIYTISFQRWTCPSTMHMLLPKYNANAAEQLSSRQVQTEQDQTSWPVL